MFHYFTSSLPVYPKKCYAINRRAFLIDTSASAARYVIRPNGTLVLTYNVKRDDSKYSTLYYFHVHTLFTYRLYTVRTPSMYVSTYVLTHSE